MERWNKARQLAEERLHELKCGRIDEGEKLERLLRELLQSITNAETLSDLPAQLEASFDKINKDWSRPPQTARPYL